MFSRRVGPLPAMIPTWYLNKNKVSFYKDLFIDTYGGEFNISPWTTYGKLNEREKRLSTHMVN